MNRLCELVGDVQRMRHALHLRTGQWTMRRLRDAAAVALFEDATHDVSAVNCETENVSSALVSIHDTSFRLTRGFWFCVYECSCACVRVRVFARVCACVWLCPQHSSENTFCPVSHWMSHVLLTCADKLTQRFPTCTTRERTQWNRLHSCCGFHCSVGIFESTLGCVYVRK